MAQKSDDQKNILPQLFLCNVLNEPSAASMFMCDVEPDCVSALLELYELMWRRTEILSSYYLLRHHAIQLVAVHVTHIQGGV